MHKRDRLKIITANIKNTTMKQTKKSPKNLSLRLSVPVVTLASLLTIGNAYVPVTQADSFDDQINALQQQNGQNQSAIDGLQAQASSYQDAISKLQAQISTIQTQINANQAKQADLQNQIQQDQVELDKQKATLGADIKSMYVDGTPSTIEMLATSGNLSNFVDKEEYRTAVQNKIQDTLGQITKLQNQLKTQKQQVDQLLQDQKNQQAQLDSDKAQQDQLLAMNEGQQASYNQQIQSNQSKIGDLRRQQAILNSRYNIGGFKTSADHGGYPDAWNNAPQDSMLDPWGMYNRECVSFTAFKVHEDYLAGKNNHDMPYWGGAGNANQWDDNARAAGIPVDSNPTAGSIAISNAGTWGHAMYVEAVGTINGQQAIYVEQYNADFQGTYSEGWRYTTGLVFIHF
jgi:surface antigen/predicted  nucleic acid-binding Zn-ribbon protein